MPNFCPRLVVLIICFTNIGSFAQVAFNEIQIKNQTIDDDNGDFFPWVELKNVSNLEADLAEFQLVINSFDTIQWPFDSLIIPPRSRCLIWLSDTSEVDHPFEMHVLLSDRNSIDRFDLINDQNKFAVSSLLTDPLQNSSNVLVRYPELSNKWIIAQPAYGTPLEKNTYPSQWHKLLSATPFQPRDNSPNSILVYNGAMWMLSGETRDENGIWYTLTDVWKSENGISWELVNEQAPYKHISSFVVFQNQMWAFDENAYTSNDGTSWNLQSGGIPFESFKTRVVVHNGELINVTQKKVYRSLNGTDWDVINSNAPWSDRQLPRLVSFKGKLWFIGGVQNYGNAAVEVLNDIWQSSDGGVTWTQELSSNIWPARIWPTILNYQDQLWLMGGWSPEGPQDFAASYGNLNDTWTSQNGIDWYKFDQPLTWARRHAMYACIFKDQIHVIAGYGGGGISQLWNDVWRLDLRRDAFVSTGPVLERTYGDPDFSIVNEVDEVGVRYYDTGNDVLSADGDSEIEIRSAGKEFVIIETSGNDKFLPTDTLVEVTVAKKLLSLKAPDIRVPFGSIEPDLVVDIQGFAYDDDADSLSSIPQAVTQASSLSPIGVYPITIQTTPDKNYAYVIEEGTLSITESAVAVIAYPNPTTDNLNIIPSVSTTTAKITIFDSMGREARTVVTPPVDGEFRIDMEDLSPGMYFYVITDGHYKFTGKVIKG